MFDIKNTKHLVVKYNLKKKKAVLWKTFIKTIWNMVQITQYYKFILSNYHH